MPTCLLLHLWNQAPETTFSKKFLWFAMSITVMIPDCASTNQLLVRAKNGDGFSSYQFMFICILKTQRMCFLNLSDSLKYAWSSLYGILKVLFSHNYPNKADRDYITLKESMFFVSSTHIWNHLKKTSLVVGEADDSGLRKSRILCMLPLLNCWSFWSC